MPFDQLTSLEQHLLSKVLDKVHYKAGIGLYQTCKLLKDEIDYLRPRWRVDELTIDYIDYMGGYRHLQWRKTDNGGARLGIAQAAKETDNFEFFIPKTVSVTAPAPASMRPSGAPMPRDPDFFERVVFPDLRKMASVPLLVIYSMEQDLLQNVLDAARPLAIQINETEHDVYNPLFENIKNLNIIARRSKAAWSDPQRVFDLGRTRKTISLSMDKPPRQMFLDILKRWLSGVDVGTMEEFAVWADNHLAEEHRAIIDEETVRADAKEIQELGEGETAIKRQGDSGRDRLRLKTTERSLEFHFE